jgi:hypothetical protein
MPAGVSRVVETAYFAPLSIDALRRAIAETPFGHSRQLSPFENSHLSNAE